MEKSSVANGKSKITEGKARKQGGIFIAKAAVCALAVPGLLLCVADCENLVTLVATKVAGMALLYIGVKVWEWFVPDDEEV